MDITASPLTYEGPYTKGAHQHFNIGQERWPSSFIHAFGLQKAAAAYANTQLGILPQSIGVSLQKACEELMEGQWDHCFTLSLWQSGSGTQIHMNVNEVLAWRASSLSGTPVNPYDHVNASQSSNDTVPTVMHITLVQAMFDFFFPALEKIAHQCSLHGEAWKDIQKIGRTHLQDAVTMNLGDEFSAFSYQLKECHKGFVHRLKDLYPLAQGGTAVGNSVNCPPPFKDIFFSFLREKLPFPFYPAPNTFAAQSAHDGLVALSGDLATLACVLSKIAMDLRWMTSGPRCGLGELFQPHNEAGSSIMPGKINPSQAEMLTMIAYQVMGWHHAIVFAGIGQFQLNTSKPLIFYNLWHSLLLLAQGIESFTTYFLSRLTPCKEHLAHSVAHNLMDLTCLTPEWGYRRVGQWIAEASLDSLSVQEAKERFLSEERKKEEPS